MMSSLNDLTGIKMGSLVVRSEDFVRWISGDITDVPTYVVTTDVKICMGTLCVDIIGERSIEDVPVGKLMGISL